MAGLKTTLAGAKVYISTAAVTLPPRRSRIRALTFTEITSRGNLGTMVPPEYHQLQHARY